MRGGNKIIENKKLEIGKGAKYKMKKRFQFLRQKKRTNRTLAALLTFAMLPALLTGCGTPSGEREGTNSQGAGGTTAEGQDTSQASDSMAMGRYVEEITDLSDRISGYGDSLYRMNDGSLVIADKWMGFLISKDNGATWEEDPREWHTEMVENQTYIMSLGVGPDNTVGVIYDDESYSDTETEAQEENTDSQEEAAETDDTKEAGSSEEEAAESEYEEPELNPKCLIVKPDGTQMPVDIPVTEEDSYLYNVYIADNGRIFVTTMGGGNIYEVKEDGSSELFLTLETDSRPELIRFQDNLMIIDGYGCKGLLLYDLDQEEYIEDEVLDQFVDENYKDRNSIGSDSYSMYFFPGEEGVLYLAGAKGLYRHVIGGSAIEQVIDGSLCTFNNPAYSIYGMTVLDNNEFMTLFTGSKLVRFVYDPDIPTVPNEKLKVYSLKENDTIRQAITLYQAANPEVFVEYEVGMGEDSSLTKDDALKSLNTEIMAGEGPDVLILDDMPLASYIEKGLLLDLSSALSSLEGEEELFANIVDAVKTDDKVYMVPCEIQLPVIVADQKYTSAAKNLEGIADAVEELRSDYPDKDLLGLCTERSVMRLFAMTCVPSWITESGEINREAITEFLTQTKRIYDAQMDGIPDASVDDYNARNEYYLEEDGQTWEDSDYFRTSVNIINLIGGFSYMECGALSYAYGYANVISADKVKNYENSEWIPMTGQNSNVFCAQTLLGINAASKNSGRAEDFIKVCLGKENQSNLFKGFAVNKAAFAQSFVVKEEAIDEDGIYGAVCVSDKDGLYIELPVYWPTEEQIEELRNYLETVDTVYIKDDRLEEAVYEEGVLYMKGHHSLEETVSGIEKKVSLYMAE